VGALAGPVRRLEILPAGRFSVRGAYGESSRYHYHYLDKAV
jgi:hypothetical protein